MLRKLSRFLLICVAWIVAAILALTYGPLLIPGPDQDHCSFGPVTNKQYRAFLADAKQRQRTVWQGFSNDELKISDTLTARAREMIGAERSLYKQLAITHAVLRAIGAEYLNAGGVPNFNPYTTDKPVDVVGLSYLVDINRLVWFQPYPRSVWVRTQLFDPSGRLPDIRRSKGNNFEIVALIVDVFRQPVRGSLVSDSTNCPPIPDAATAERYESLN